MTIPSLDGLRAVSIGLVFASHVGYELTPGGFGVTVFFVLSGYLITTLLRVEHDRDHSISLTAFYRRRFFRIWPALYAVLGIGAVLTLTVGLGNGHVDTFPFLSQVLHYINYFSILYHGKQQPMLGTGVYWSLAVEEHFYLVLPVLFVVLNRLRFAYRNQAVTFLALAAAVVVWRCVLVFYFHASQGRTYYSTDTRADALLLGCALALHRNPMIDPVRETEPQSRAAAILGGAAIVGSLVVRNFEFREGFRYTIQALALVFIIRYVIVAPHSIAGRILNSRPFVWFGQLSFAFYLVHLVVIAEVYKHLQNKMVVAIVTFTLSVSIAWTLQRFVMNPATHLRQRIDARKIAMIASPVP